MSPAYREGSHPASSSACQPVSRKTRCCGSITSASRGGTLKKVRSNHSGRSTTPRAPTKPWQLPQGLRVVPRRRQFFVRKAPHAVAPSHQISPESRRVGRVRESPCEPDDGDALRLVTHVVQGETSRHRARKEGLVAALRVAPSSLTNRAVLGRESKVSFVGETDRVWQSPCL